MATRAARISLWVAAGFVILVLGGWILLPHFVSSEFVRTAIERELADLTGQRIRVGGAVDIELFPSPIARLHDVHAMHSASRGDGTGKPPGDFMEVDVVEVAIPLSSLLAREPAFSQFRLIRPVMRIATGSSGPVDPGSVGGRLGRAITGLQADTDVPATRDRDRDLNYVRFGTVTVEDGAVEFVGDGADADDKVTAISGVVSWPRLTQRLTATLKGEWRGVTFQQKAEIDNAIHFLAGDISDARLSFTSDRLTYSFDGKIALGQAPFAEGALSLTAPSARKAMGWLRMPVRPGAVIGKVSVEGMLRADARKARVENLKLALQDSAGTGVLEVSFKDQAKPALTATLDFSRVDLLAFMSVVTGSPVATANIDEPVSRALLGQLDVDVRLSATSATAGVLQLTDIAAVIQIRNGTALFEVADATGYGGKGQARLEIADKDGTLTANFGVSCADVNSAAIADALSVGGLFPRGVATGNLSVSAPLERWGDLLKRASGKAEMRVVNGLVPGISFQTFGGADEPKTFFRLQDNAHTSDVFASMNLSAVVQDGAMIIEKGEVEYPAGTIRLNGVVPYGSASIALTVIARPNADGPDAPVVQHFIGGSWSNPYATPVFLPRQFE